MPLVKDLNVGDPVYIYGYDKDSLSADITSFIGVGKVLENSTKDDKRICFINVRCHGVNYNAYYRGNFRFLYSYLPGVIISSCNLDVPRKYDVIKACHRNMLFRNILHSNNKEG